MSFNNPILAGETLVRTGMKSENFQSGLQGWRVDRNGDAEFNDVYIRGSTSGDSAAYDVVFVNESLYYQGEELTQYAQQFGLGLVVWGELPVQEYLAGDRSKLIELQFEAGPDRAYEIVMNPFRAASTAADTHAAVSFDYTTDGSDPGSSSNETRVFTTEVNFEDANSYQTLSGTHLFHPGVAATVRVVMFFEPIVGTGDIKLNYDAPGFAIYDRGMWKQNTAIDRYIPPSGGSEGGATKTKYNFNHAITSSKSYRGDGSLFNENDSMYQGYSPYAPENGNMSSFGELNINDLDALIGVPKSDYNYLEWYFYYDHWHYNAGGTAVVGSYDRNGFQRTDLFRFDIGRDAGRWINVLDNPTIFDAINGGWMLGVKLGPGDGTDPQFYGYARGATQALAVGMRAEYYK